MFGDIPDWLGWRSLGEWSGHWPDFLPLALRMWTTLAAGAYLRWPDCPFGLSIMPISKSCLCLYVMLIRGGATDSQTRFPTSEKRGWVLTEPDECGEILTDACVYNSL